MMENTTDRLFWTLTAVIVGALLLTISVKAFPNIASSALAPMGGIMKQADVATSNVGKVANTALANNTDGPTTNQTTTTNTPQLTAAQQADAAAKAAATVPNPSGPATGENFDTSQPGFTVSKDSNGNGVITNMYIPQGTTTITIPEYMVYKEAYYSKPETVKIVGIDGQSDNILSKLGLTQDISAITTVNLPSSLQYVGADTFNDEGYSGFVKRPKYVTINLPKTAQIGNDAFGGAYQTNTEIPHFY